MLESIIPLDQAIEAGLEQLNRQQQQQCQAKENFDRAQQQLQGSEQQHRNLAVEYEATTAFIGAHPLYRQLAELLPLWQNRFAQLEQQTKEQNLLLEKRAELERQLQQTRDGYERQKKEQDNTGVLSRQAQEKMQALVGDKQALLAQYQGADEQQLAAELTRLQDMQPQAAKALENARRFARLDGQIKQQQSQVKEITLELTAITAERDQLRQTFAKEQQILRDLETLIHQQQTIMSLSAHREQLQPGEACPLCGSREHPAIAEYAGVSSSDHQVRLEQQKQLLKDIEKQGLELNKQGSKLQGRHDTLLESLTLNQREQEELLLAWQGLQTALAFSYPLTQTRAIEESLLELEAKLALLTAQHQQLQQLNQAINQQQQAAAQLEKATMALQNQCDLSANKLNFEQQAIAEMREQEQRQQAAYQEIRQQLTVELKGCALDYPLEDRFEAWWQEQEKRVQDYQDALVRKETQKEQLAAQRQNAAVLQEQVRHLAGEVQQIEDLLVQYRRQVEQKQEQRRSLFGEQTVAEVRAGIAAKRQALEQQLADQQQASSHAQEQVKLLQGQLQASRQQLAQAEQQLKNVCQQWQLQLTESIFEQESDFVAALLPEEKRRELTRLKQELTEQKQAAQTLMSRAEQEHEKLLVSRAVLPDDPGSRDELHRQLAEIQQTLKQAQQKQGELKQKLAHDQELRDRQGLLLQKIDEKKQQLEDLSCLNGLIGSADGAKFRRFAQGLTLAHLVYLANLQLERLHGRYQLQCQENDTLALQVLDTWQGDSLRDTKTLSGGESFLVSLALALALSDLVSVKTSIDSLFLDEGFGTLDNDTLEIALDALDNLNASGKMIGVISHVETLKERIAVQIKVKKFNGLGVSELQSQFRYSPGP